MCVLFIVCDASLEHNQDEWDTLLPEKKIRPPLVEFGAFWQILNFDPCFPTFQGKGEVEEKNSAKNCSNEVSRQI